MTLKSHFVCLTISFFLTLFHEIFLILACWLFFWGLTLCDKSIKKQKSQSPHVRAYQFFLLIGIFFSVGTIFLGSLWLK